MGLLDDAIREHLDLKRQHGADESELRRKENEALGPARREAPAPEAEEAVVQEEALPGHEEPPVVAEAPAIEAEEPPVVADTPAIEADLPAAEEELADSEDLAIEDFEEDTAIAAPPLPPEEDDELLPPAPVEPAPAGREDPFDEPPPPPPPPEDGEDVLEETPEFLQDTPEHDRLWFEQKPPRDFDFDEE